MSRIDWSPFRKDFYRISKERLEAYLDKLKEASDLLKELKNDKGKTDWEVVDMAWRKIVDVMNSLSGFKNYEDTEAGGEQIDDFYLYDWTELDNYKFCMIEFHKEKEAKMEQKDKEDKKFDIELTGLQVAIMKAALQYFQLDDDFGYALWGETAAIFDSDDRLYRHLSNEIYKKLDALTDIEPDFGWWGDIKRMFKLGKKELDKVKREQKKINEDLDREHKLVERFVKHISGHGLNGEEVRSEVYEEMRKEWEAENTKKQHEIQI